MRQIQNRHWRPGFDLPINVLPPASSLTISPVDPHAETSRSRPPSKVPRISRLMALAIRLDEMLRTGEVSDMIELVRRGHVTQPRMSQIMALNQLAPEIQEALLNLPATRGKPEIHEKRLRTIATMLSWEDQRLAWRGIQQIAGSQEAESRERRKQETQTGCMKRAQSCTIGGCW